MVIIEMSANERLIKMAVQQLNDRNEPINHEALAYMAGCSQRTVRRVMRKLKATGEIEKRGNPRHGFIYQLRDLG